jgi:hypothetical protein
MVYLIDPAYYLIPFLGPSLISGPGPADDVLNMMMFRSARISFVFLNLAGIRNQHAQIHVKIVHSNSKNLPAAAGLNATFHSKMHEVRKNLDNAILNFCIKYTPSCAGSEGNERDSTRTLHVQIMYSIKHFLRNYYINSWLHLLNNMYHLLRLI